MTRKQIADETFRAAPYRVYYGPMGFGSIRTFTNREHAIAFAKSRGGAAYAGTADDMTAGRGERIR